MWRYVRWICIGLMALGAKGLFAQQPSSRLPATKAELWQKADSAVVNDSLAALRIDLDSLLSLKADTSVTNELQRLIDALEAVRDSLRNGIDSINTNLAAEATARATADSLLAEGIIRVIAGDTTSPGKAYAPDTLTGKWVRADTSITVRALGFALDSVLPDATVRIKIAGILRFPGIGWNWTPGLPLFSDSTTAGEIGYGGQAAPKKMQLVAVAIDSVTVRCFFDPTIAY